MNQGRIWCVVNPTVGLPLFLGSVAVTSLIVHFSVLNNTTWFASYWNGGKAKAKVAAVEDTTSTVATSSVNGAPGLVISVAPTGTAGNGTASYVITVAPQPGATAVADSTSARLPDSLALAAASTK